MRVALGQPRHELRGAETEQRTDADDVRSCIRDERSAVLLAIRDDALVACAHIAVQDGAAHA